MREIGCDESGYEGAKLVGGETDVFAHAGTGMGVDAAAALVAELRSRIRSPAQEYKANHLLRPKHRAVLQWLLGPASPMYGTAHVHLIDKTWFLLRHLGLGPAARHRVDLLVAANDLLRARPGSADSVHRSVDAWGCDEARAVLSVLRPGSAPPDLLEPAILRAVDIWGTGGVSIVHDRQITLTDARIAALLDRAPRLTGIRLVESRMDPRIQVADFLAGVARRIASDELAGRGDAALVELLWPYVDPASTWGDDRSRATLISRPRRRAV